MAKKLNNPRWMKVIEEYIWSENIPLTVLAKRTDVPYDTIVRWFRNNDFLKALEKRFYDAQTVEWLQCVKSMIREAQAGNSSAFREVKPIIEKNIARVEGMVAPYTQYIQINNMGSEEKNSSESIQDPMLEVRGKVHSEVHEVPKVHMNHREEKERVEVIKKTYKKQKINKTKRNALMKLKRRAKKVGLAPLGSGRPSKTEKVKWLNKLEKLEEKQGIKHPSP